MRGALALQYQLATFGITTMLNSEYTSTHVAPRAQRGAGEPRNALAAILAPADIILELDVSTKARFLQEIARVVGERNGLHAVDVYASLVERERIGSTALGCGVALPHARVKGLARPVAAFARPRLALPFEAPDLKPVTDVLVLLVPRQATDEHLLLLAQAAEMFCDQSFREDLAACTRADEVHAAINEWRPA